MPGLNEVGLPGGVEADAAGFRQLRWAGTRPGGAGPGSSRPTGSRPAGTHRPVRA
ncbi:hypothetical protein SAMN05444365_10527 [Micromonospora pattaloongensis]|uniref:Uncharacterized protein n=1 Tax=Micromonospora pattaloongensis TaxID=405436 RepID=A0A1H3PUH9_9ACTN|nr:hypothetical protein [Micromonospora pattaloongensis]SDZ04598.1 hypothetical protein SAMN05444365_10527 [Micromonospora pattaloongensis]